MGVINTGLIAKGVRSDFFSRYDSTKTHFQDLATRIASDSDTEIYKWLGSTPRMREWGTGRVAKGIRTESYSVENQKYEATIEVDLPPSMVPLPMLVPHVRIHNRRRAEWSP